MNNKTIFYFQHAAYSCVNIIVDGTIFQTFLLECGIGEAKVSIYFSVMQIVRTLAMLLLSKYSDNIKNVLRWVAICFSSQVIQLLVMGVICFATEISVDIKYWLLFAAGIVFSVFMGLCNVLSYKQPYHIINIEEYGAVSAKLGIIVGVVGMAFTALIAFASNRFSYFGSMAVVCIFSMILSILSGVINRFYKPIDVKAPTQNTRKINIFSYKPFYQLLFPNFMRGFSTGIFNLVAVIGYHSNILDKTTAALLVTLSQIATFIGCQSFLFIALRRKSGTACLISSIVMLVSLPLMSIGSSATVFLAMYFIAFFFSIIISYGVPTIVAENIEYECIGQYTAWRMALYTAGISIGGALVPTLLESVGSVGTLLISGISMLPCGIGYYIFEKNAKKRKTRNR